MQNHQQKGNSLCMFLSSRRYSAGYVSTAPVEEDKILEKTLRELSLNIQNSLVLTNKESLTAEDIVLRKCGQTEPLLFTECYPNA